MVLLFQGTGATTKRTRFSDSEQADEYGSEPTKTPDMVDLTQLDMLSPIVPNIYDKISFVIGGALHGPVQLQNNIQYLNGK